MFCKNCGKELPDGTKFCGGCGSSVTPAVPEEALGGQEQTVSLDFSAPAAAPETQAAPPASPAPEAGASDGAVSSIIKRRGKSGLVVLGVGAVAVIVVLVLAVKLIGGLLGGGGGSRTQAFAYLTDDDELMYLSDLKEKTQAIEVTDKDNPQGARFTKDGKTLYYTDRDSTLYKIAVADLKKDGRPERVARDVSRYRLLDNGSVLYSKYDSSSETYEVTCVTTKEEFRLIKECNDYSLSKDQKTVYYTEYDKEDREYTLYKIALKKDAQEEELLDGYSSLYTPYDSSVLVYDENDYSSNAGGSGDFGYQGSSGQSGDTDYNTRTVYSCKPGGEPTELQDDVYSVYGVKVDGSKVSFYYTVQDVEKYTLYDLVSDSKASEDAATLKEDLERPNWYSDFYPEDTYFENGTWYYEDYNGNKFPVDVSSLLTDGTAIAELSPYSVQNLANNEARARYDQAMEDYNARYDVWNAAKSRDRIRENLKAEETSQSSLSLYHYTGTADSDAIATGINRSQMHYSAEDGVFIYKKAAGITGGKLCDVADMSSYYDIYEYMNAGSTDDDWYQNVGDTESVLEFDEDVTSINGLYVLNGKEVVLSLSFEAGPEDNRRTERIVNAYSLGKTSLTFASTVVEDEFSGLQLAQDAKDNDILYFFTEVESKERGTLGDLNRYSGGKVEPLVKEIYSVYILDDSGAIYAVTDVSSKGERELSLIQGDKPTMITDEITGGITFLDSKQLLYIADHDLFLWDGKAGRQIAKDVSVVWANVEEVYTFLAPSSDGGYGYGGYDYDYGYNYGGSAAGFPW